MSKGINTDDIETNWNKNFAAQELELKELVKDWREKEVDLNYVVMKDRVFNDCADKVEQILNSTHRRSSHLPNSDADQIIDSFIQGVDHD